MLDPDRTFVEQAFRLVLRRAPDEEALASALARLEAGALSRAGLVAELVRSAEFESLRALDDAVALATWARLAGERPRGLRGPPASDERVIEIPWVLSRYRGEERLLDVGSAHAPAKYLRALAAAAPGRPVALDLAPAELDGFDCVTGDLRELPFEDGAFDIALCVSTLEHVGADNALYGVEGERGAGGAEQALGELARVLGGGGRLLLTVPCGAPEEHGWFGQPRRGGLAGPLRRGRPPRRRARALRARPGRLALDRRTRDGLRRGRPGRLGRALRGAPSRAETPCRASRRAPRRRTVPLMVDALPGCRCGINHLGSRA